MGGARLAIGGTAVVACVHDRVKREVTDPEHVAYLGAVAGVVFDAKRHVLHVCACCDNLFVASDDSPRFCDPCGGPVRHRLGGPLPAPVGRI